MWLDLKFLFPITSSRRDWVMRYITEIFGTIFTRNFLYILYASQLK